MEKSSPLEFLREVRREAEKVTWPTRRETVITTGLVLVMVILAALFFFFVDYGLSFVVELLLGIGR